MADDELADGMVTFVQHREAWRKMFADMRQAAAVLRFLAPGNSGREMADGLNAWAENLGEWLKPPQP